MKKFFLSLIFVVIAMVSNAQTWIGTSIGLSVVSQENESTMTEFGIFPMIRFGITDKLSAGCEAAVQVSSQNGETLNTLGISPFLRYDCFSLGNNKFFLNAGFALASTSYGQSESNITSYGVGINPGFSIPLGEDVEMELGLGGISWAQSKYEGIKSSAFSLDILSNISIGISLKF